MHKTAPDELVTVYTVANPMEAEIIKAELRNEGIDCWIGNEEQAALTGLTAMEIDIMTRAEDAPRARKILLQHEPKRKSEEED